MGIEEDVRTAWDIAPLRGLWQRAREALEAPDAPPTFRLELPDDETRSAVGELYGRPLWGYGTRINVSKLDSAVRSARFGLSLREVLEIMHGSPVRRAGSADEVAEQRHSTQYMTFQSALAEHGLHNAAWAETWISWVCQFGRVAEQDERSVARQAARVLAEITAPHSDRPWTTRAELAARAGDARALDEGTTLSRVVLRAAALAHDLQPPTNARERQQVWQSCHVASDGIADVVSCWGLPWLGTGTWASSARQRDTLGLPTQLSLADLRSAPGRLVAESTPIAVCTSPRVLEAAIAAGVDQPLVCIGDYGSGAARELLRRLFADGAAVYCHADFDWTGLRTVRTLHAAGARPWRFGSADYRAALDHAAGERLDLPVLAGEPVDTPWDAELSTLLATAGRSVGEEILLTQLVTDLRTEH